MKLNVSVDPKPYKEYVNNAASCVSVDKKSILISGGNADEDTGGCGTGGWHRYVIMKPIQNVWSYSLATKQYTALPPLPRSTYNHSMFRFKSKIYVLATHHDFPMTGIYIYNDSKWITVDINLHRKFLLNKRLCIENEKVHIVHVNQHYTMDLSNNFKIKQHNDIPFYWSVGRGFLKFHQNYIYALGGIGKDHTCKIFDLMYKFNLKTNEWSQCRNLPQNIMDFCCEIYQNKILIIGGFDYGGHGSDTYGPSKKIFIYDINTNKWILSQYELKNPVRNSASVLVNNNIHLFGGKINPNQSLNQS
eukprot:175299_1